MTRTVLITGCSTGIGNAAAKAFHQHGWNVIATLRNPASAHGLEGRDNVLVTALDVTDPDSIANAIAAGLERFGQIDAVINNAGFGSYGIFEGASEASVRAVYETNVFGVMNVIRAVLPHMRERRQGQIINISSAGGFFALPTMSVYCSSKFALEGFSEGLSHELAPLGIRVKLIEPGGVLTTNFDTRATALATDDVTPAEYAPFVDATHAMLDQMRSAATATEQQVAEVIHQAALDDSGRLRHVATDDIRELVRLRQETCEDEYMAFMRQHIVPQLH